MCRLSTICRLNGLCLGYRNDLIGAVAWSRTPVIHQLIAASSRDAQGTTVDVFVYVRTGVGAEFVFTVIGAGSTWGSSLIRWPSLEVSCSIIIAAVEIDVVRAQCHSTANSVGAVPHHLCVVTNRLAVGGAFGIQVAWHLTVPGFNDFRPRVRWGWIEQIWPQFIPIEHVGAGFSMSQNTFVNPGLSTDCYLLTIAHYQHVRSSRLNRSPEGIVLVNNLILNLCVFCANVCWHTQKHTHLNPLGKQHIKDKIQSDIYSGGWISMIWITNISWFNYSEMAWHNKRTHREDCTKSHNLTGGLIGRVLMLEN